MYPVLFKIGPITIYSLGLLWALGALAAVWILRLELKRYGYDPEIAASVVLAAAIAGLLGARLLFILEEWENFRQAPFEFLFSGAGFSWYGGLLAGAVAAAWVFKKNNLPLPQAADISAPALALGYGIGRIGCFLAGDATWGKVTDVPWAMAFPNAVAGWVDPLTGMPYPPGVESSSDAALRACPVTIRFRYPVDSQKKILSCRNDPLPLFGAAGPCGLLWNSGVPIQSSVSV
jgi:prolipoprotein diacylglyceryl transferase